MLKLKLVKEAVGDSIELGTYNGKPLTWTMIGKISGKDLYLCDEILEYCVFGRVSDYTSSNARKHCLNLYNNYFSDEDRERVVLHPTLRDPVFLLSKEEYTRRKSAIKLMDKIWWLRSEGNYPALAAYVNVDRVYDNGVLSVIPGVRPAILLKS